MTSRSPAVSCLLRAISVVLGVATPRLAYAQEPFGTANADQRETPPTSRAVHADRTDWDLADPVPPGYHLEPRVRRNVIVRGAGLLVLMYIPSAFFAAALRDEAPLAIPVAGPFIQLGRTSSIAPGIVVLFGDGLLQILGAGMIAYGLALPAHVLVPNAEPSHVSLVPFATANGGHGIGVVGIF